jgi:hypothetical protein
LVVREPHLWRNALLYPFRDLLGFFFWSASYLGNQVVWRGEVYELLRGGLMRNKRSPTLPTSPASISPPPPVGSLGLNRPACTDSSQTYGLPT